MPKAHDLTGKKYGRLTAVTRVQNTDQGRAQWLCRCDCGGEKIVHASQLNKGATRSCGCLGIEQRRAIAQQQCHDLSKRNNRREYSSWQNMIARCYAPSTNGYANYGGRGIRVCNRWHESFAAFLADMGARPDGASLDRVSSSADYSPENCRWATRQAQANNRRTNRVITIDGARRTVAEWARHLGISCHVIHSRLANGKSEHDAVMTPVRTRQPK